MIGNNYIIISLAMDLKRVAMGLHGGSNATVQRFFQEALKRKSEIKEEEIKPYLLDFLNKIPALLDQKDNKKIAEDALMYSTIFQNYALHENN